MFVVTPFLSLLRFSHRIHPPYAKLTADPNAAMARLTLKLV